MFQTFDEKTVSETSKNRIYLLREEMRKKNIDAFFWFSRNGNDSNWGYIHWLYRL